MIQPPKQSDEGSDLGIDLTALMDVVFILLIFFILTSGVTQMFTEVKLPREDQVRNLAPVTTTPIVVQLQASAPQWRVKDQAFSTETEARQHVLSELLNRPERGVVIAPDRDLPSEILVQWLNFLASESITSVRIVSQWSER